MSTCLVASDSDPWMSATQAHAWAHLWGCDWINLGDAGHINVESGYGPFPLAREWARRRVEPPRRPALARRGLSQALLRCKT